VSRKRLLLAALLFALAASLALLLPGRRAAKAEGEGRSGLAASAAEVPPEPEVPASGDPRGSPDVPRGEAAPVAGPGRLLGKVVEKRSRAAVPGAAVRVLRDPPGAEGLARRLEGLGGRTREKEGLVAQTRADETGSFVLEGLEEGTFFLEAVSARSFSADWTRASVSAKEAAPPVVLEVEIGARVVGRVLGRDGPVAGATVELRPGPANFLEFFRERTYRWREARTDGEGRFAIDGVPPGEGLLLTARAGEYAPTHVRNLEARAGEDTAIEVRLSRGGAVAGRVLDGSGSPMAGAEVRVAPVGIEDMLEADSFASAPATANEKGAYRVSGLPVGLVEIAASAEGRPPTLRRGVRIREDRTTEGIDLVLEEGHAIAGCVVDGSGGPIAGAEVRAETFEPRFFSILAPHMLGRNVARSDASGRFRIAGLTGGDHALVASATGFGRARVPGVRADREDVRVVLEPVGSIAGIVLDRESAEPLARFTVRARPTRRDSTDGGGPRLGRGGPSPFGGRGPEGASVSRTFEAGDGKFALDGVPPGTVAVTVSAEGFSEERLEGVVVPPGATAKGLIARLGKGGTIRGLVLRGQDGSPVPGARVSASKGGEPFAGFATSVGLRGSGVESDAEGRFEVRNLAPGLYRLLASHAELARGEVPEVDVGEGSVVEGVEVRLGIGGAIFGAVADPEGSPVAGSTVLAFSLPGGDVRQARTDGEGAYEIPLLPAGSYQVLTTRADEDRTFTSLLGHLRWRQATVREGERARLDIVDDSSVGCRVHGTVLDGGAPVPGTTLFVLGSGGGPFRLTTKAAVTDEVGAYEIRGLPAGTYTFRVGDFGAENQGARFEIDVPEAAEATVDLVLPRARISGRVVEEETGKPVRGVEVSLANLDRSDGLLSGFLGEAMRERQAAARSDAEGSFRFDRVTPGRYRLTARVNSFRSSEEVALAPAALDEVAVGDGEDLTGVELRMKAGASLRGKVTDASGRPVPLASATLVPEGGEVRLFPDAVTDREGAFRASGLAPGRYRVVLEAEGFARLEAEGILVEVGGNAEGAYTLRRGARLLVRAVDSSGRSVREARIEVLDAAGKSVRERPGPGRMLRAIFGGEDGSGTAEVGSLAPGRYRVRATGKGGKAAEAAVDLAEGEERRVDLTVP
jgi:protocatechuate 3,4-dioxygenase beta subunit